MALVPDDIKVGGNVKVDVNINVDAEKISQAVREVIWAVCMASIARSWFRKK